ncbi:MAG TPA: DUF655 domain-containing protein [Candidatus Nanoarchaeia archaeon]|nr:DUF655 domain-containing protein [Candidatus Nanoarchaeia archaeon]
MTEKEEYAIILDFLKHGYPEDSKPLHKKMPVAQAIGETHFVLLELVPKPEIFLQPIERVYIGEGKREKIHHIIGKIIPSKLTQTAQNELPFVIKELILKNPDKFINFFNIAGPINMRSHQLELLPGIGKKHMLQILDARKDGNFKSFIDLKTRVALIPDPEKTITKRILMELEGNEKYTIFVEK